LSHRSAASLWGLLRYPASAPVCVTVSPERRCTRPGIAVHRSRLTVGEVRRRQGLALTSPPRTIYDLSRRLGQDDLEALVAEANYRHLASEWELRRQLDHNPGKPGAAVLRAVLEIPGGARRTRSPAERTMLRLLRRAGAEGFENNARVHGYEVDLLWRDLDLAIEIDGWDGHSGRIAFERDRLKIATLNAHGITVMPITGRQVRRDADGVLRRLLQAIAVAEPRAVGSETPRAP
jgi:very-short-patch-repair endonuclease